MHYQTFAFLIPSPVRPGESERVDVWYLDAYQGYTSTELVWVCITNKNVSSGLKLVHTWIQKAEKILCGHFRGF